MLVKARSMAYFRCIAYSSRHHNCTDNDCNNKFHHSQKQFPKVNKQVQFRSESFGEINFHVGRRRYFFLFIRFFYASFLAIFSHHLKSIENVQKCFIFKIGGIFELNKMDWIEPGVKMRQNFPTFAFHFGPNSSK